MKLRIVKFVRNMTIGFFVLLIILLSAGVIYTWYAGQNTPEDVPMQENLKESGLVPKIKPPVISPDAKVGVSVQMITSPLLPGTNASMTIKTNPNANCTIKAEYNKIPSTDSGLTKKTADEYGIVSWTWTVEGSVPLGKWPVTVTCANAKYSGVVVGDLVVSNKVE